MASTTSSSGSGRSRMNGNGHRRPITLAAEKFRNQQVLTREGQAGKVMDLLVDDEGHYLAAVDFGRDHGAHEVPLNSLAYEDNHFVVPDLAESEVWSLPTFLEGRLQSVEPGTTVDVEGYRSVEDSSVFVQQAPAQVRVERPALQIHWDQPAPQVTVHQPTPRVNVRQMRPVIVVRQPPPIVTVELTQPEIIVRMAEPEVDVSVAEAQVHVSVPKPNVQFVQPAQPEMNFVSSEPLVALKPRSQADVAIHRADPIVHYERTGDPQVIFRPAPGGPQIRFEDMTAEEARQLLGEASSLMAERATTDQMTTGQLLGREAYDSRGDRVGKVSRVLADQQGALFLVVERFLGRKRLLPIESFAMSGERLVIPRMTDSDLRGMEDWEEHADDYVPVASDGTLQIAHDA